MKPLRQQLAVYLFCGLPFLLWFFVFWKTVHGNSLNYHGIDYYRIIKFLMENLTRGVFPAWDPFSCWGRPDDIDQRFVGEFNPFLWLYPFFTALQLPRPMAYMLYSFSYFQIGNWGFYLLAKRILKDRSLAVIAAALLMFSSVAFSIFTNFCLNLLMVPVIWFFYFLLSFAQEPRRHFFLGLIFSASIIAITYMPFYFLTILEPFLLGMFLLYFRATKEFFCSTILFCRQNIIFVFLCLIFLGFSLIPGIQWFLDSRSGDMILSWRHSGSGDANTASMGLGTIQAGMIAQFLDLNGLFSGLKSFEHMVFTISFFVYLVLSLSVLNKINRQQILLGAIAAWLFLISLGEITPVHKFLYDHIYFYRLFRNLNYFIDFLVPVVILFSVEQLRLILSADFSTRKIKFLRIAFVWTVHACWVVYLCSLGDVLISSYLTIMASALFFMFYYAGILASRSLLAGFLLLGVALLQPLEYFQFFVRQICSNEISTPRENFFPKFSYLRPRSVEELFFKGKDSSQIQDSAGYVPWKYTGLRWSYDLQNNVAQNNLEPYTRYKFVLYDGVKEIEREKIDFTALEKALSENSAAAFVFRQRNPEPLNFPPPPGSTPEFVPAETDKLGVTQFDLNEIHLKTNYPIRKFLVYNDSYHKDWQAFINNQSVPIYQANIAFKGIWLPPGKNEVIFLYQSPGKQGLNFFLVGLFASALLCLVGLTIRSVRKKDDVAVSRK